MEYELLRWVLCLRFIQVESVSMILDTELLPPVKNIILGFVQLIFIHIIHAPITVGWFYYCRENFTTTVGRFLSSTL